MNLSDTLRSLIRRWYIVVAGMVLAATAAYGAWTHVSPAYERSSSQLLLPGKGLMPTNASNPYLYIGSLTQAADVVVRVVGTNDTVTKIMEQNPGTQIVVQRDPTDSGPVILITVTATSDRVAAETLRTMVAQTSIQLAKLQDSEGIVGHDRISVETLTLDQKPTLQQKKRLVMTGGAAIGILVFSMVVASLFDGLLRARSRRRATRAEDAGPGVELVTSNEAEHAIDRHRAVQAHDGDRRRRLQAVGQKPAEVPLEASPDSAERAFEERSTSEGNRNALEPSRRL